jgi:hypothetical protein
MRTGERKEKMASMTKAMGEKRGKSTLIYLSQDFTFLMSTDKSYQEQPRNTPSAWIANYQVTKTS